MDFRAGSDTIKAAKIGATSMPQILAMRVQTFRMFLQTLADAVKRKFAKSLQDAAYTSRRSAVSVLGRKNVNIIIIFCVDVVPLVFVAVASVSTLL